MKKIITSLVLAAAAVSAHAGVIGTMVNNAGGRIELHETSTNGSRMGAQANCGSGSRFAKAWGNSISDQWGCWNYYESSNTVVIWWPEQGESRTYDADSFTQTAYSRNKNKGGA